jgi:glycine/D-amino acid oxidase-like deaminating enzyme/nitrite reductase/ring-hydroxylating ferredoxin subunit
MAPQPSPSKLASEASVSVWMDIEVAPAAPQLTSDLVVDAVIVGAGIAGLSCAYELCQQGLRVAVIDMGRIGGGMTSRTTAHLTSVCDDSFEALSRTRGAKNANLYYASHAAAIDRIEQVQKQEGIACAFRRVPGFLFAAKEGDRPKLEREFEAAREIGVRVQRHATLTHVFASGPCLEFADQATFHPLEYLRGLARAIVAKGGALFAQTPAERFSEEKAGVRVTTRAGHVIEAGSAIVATNSPVNDLVAIHTKQAPYRTYAMAFQIAADILADALYWDTEDPYHYVRRLHGQDHDDLLIVGGEDHKTGEADDALERFARLETWARRMITRLGPETHRWSGQVMESIDGAGFIGRNPGNDRIFTVTGDSGDGMTHGVVGSLLVSRLIAGQPAEWESLYEPSRKPLTTIKAYLSENMTAVKNFAEYIAPGELPTLEALKAGEGAIVRRGTHKLAAYRDERGQLYVHSAMCTHAGCHVHWNSLERCWDCPCHGSHFAPTGEVLNGPAIFPLKKFEN